MFCSGMFSYAKANNYVKELHSNILAVFDAFKSKENDTNEEIPTQPQTSAATEIKKRIT